MLRDGRDFGRGENKIKKKSHIHDGDKLNERRDIPLETG